jgi:UPF0755 protein
VSTEPSWDDIFRSQPGAAAPQPSASAAPLTRRELREAEARGGSPQQKRRSMYDAGNGQPPRKKKRRLIWLWVLLGLLALGAAGSATAWVLFEDKIRQVMGWELPIDYTGTGNGTEVDVVIKAGDIGEDVARTLHDAGVTMTFEAFYQLLLETTPPPEFQPGTYALEGEMSAKSALAALADPANRIVSRVLIKEGTKLPATLQLLADGTGVSIEDFQTAAADLASFGIPSEAPSMEGYLFPATYTFDPGLSAHDILQTLVSRTFESLDAQGVAPEDRHRILTIASLAQKEARVEGDFYKVSRVVQNRLDAGMKLEFDSTAHYGAESQGSVWTSAEERADDNPYNTYFHTGLPIGPIGAPGDTAIDAAIHPADGTWLYFVAVNLATGETEFNTTLAEHNKSVAKLKAWCKTAEAANYCD